MICELCQGDKNLAFLISGKLRWVICPFCEGRGTSHLDFGPSSVKVHNPGRNKNVPKGYKKANKYWDDLGFVFPL